MRFLFDGGDGDQDVFSHRFVASQVAEHWFKNDLVRGPAYLLLVEDGPLAGEHLAVTSRLVASLEEQAANADYLSVVVHRIKDGPDYDASSADAIGMTAIKIIDR